MKERVAFVNQPERETHGGSFLCGSLVKTAPELLRRKQSKRRRIPASKDRTCWGLKSEKSRWNRASLMNSMHPWNGTVMLCSSRGAFLIHFTPPFIRQKSNE